MTPRIHGHENSTRVLCAATAHASPDVKVVVCPAAAAAATASASTTVQTTEDTVKIDI